MAVRRKITKLPQVRMCVDPKNPEYRSVAIEADLPGAAWFIARPGGPGAGGHWVSDDALVKNWPALLIPEPEPVT